MVYRSNIRLLTSAVFVLLLLFVGCAGPRQAMLPLPDGRLEGVPEDIHVLRVGDFARIETTSGDVVLGEVKKIAPRQVVLGRVGNYGYVEKSILADEVVSIELDGGETAGSAAGKVGGILGLTAVVFIVSFLALGSVGSN